MLNIILAIDKDLKFKMHFTYTLHYPDKQNYPKFLLSYDLSFAFLWLFEVNDQFE